MIRKEVLFFVSILGVVLIFQNITTTFAQEWTDYNINDPGISETTSQLPPWIKNNFKWYADGTISENEVLNAIKYLADNNIIRIHPQGPMSQSMQQFRNNPQLMHDWMTPMMDDPNLRQQMYDSMYDHNPFMRGMMADPQFQNQWGGHMMGRGMMGHGMMGGYQSSTQSIPSGEDSQTRTFDISMEEVEFMAEVVTEDGEEQFAMVELHTWEPDLIIVNQGDTVVLNISNPRKHSHTFSIPEFGVNTKILEPREGFDSVTFVADTPGVFTFYCGLPYNPAKLQCDPDHSMMTGTLIVLE